MTSVVHNITFDCADARTVADFWAALTGRHVFFDDDPEVLVATSYPPSGTSLLFIPVPRARPSRIGSTSTSNRPT